MSFEILVSEQGKVLETRLSGDIIYREILEFVDRMIKLTMEKDTTSWIIDYTHARYRLNTLEIHDLPGEIFRRMEVLGDKKRRVKRAIIRINDVKDFSFLEAVSFNRGQNVRVFDNRQDAMSWLNKQIPLPAGGKPS